MNEPKNGRYDFSGSCAPNGNQFMSNHTFSLGIFKWILKADGVGLKKSAVVKRIRGRVYDAEDVYRRAQAECDKLNGETPQ
jgi:hypothetical protein